MHFNYHLGEDPARIFLQVTVDIPSCGHATFLAAPFSTAFTGWAALVRRNITWHKWGYVSSQQLYQHLPVSPPLPTMFSFPLACRPSPGTCCVMGVTQGLLIATMQLWLKQSRGAEAKSQLWLAAAWGRGEFLHGLKIAIEANAQERTRGATCKMCCQNM